MGVASLKGAIEVAVGGSELSIEEDSIQYLC
jgi:hypothetical protein